MVVCIPECNGAGMGGVYVSQNAIGQAWQAEGWCEAGGTYPTGMHPCLINFKFIPYF